MPPATPPAQPARVRLSPAAIAVIRAAARRHFGAGVAVRVFGSRADPTRRGGDIDLHIEPASAAESAAESTGVAADLLARELRFYAELQRQLGLQRIDIVVRRPGQPPRPIDLAARRDGVPL